ncbi:HEAT repeat domain-containing protein [Actinomadura fibrosa]|uniref:HEAT repeat domain-containing protein n=1 Tax=Actinomadura fibrosa TaxID=111802 RepID=A0ABW2XT91_9ACTN|nr:HEAT repeat domain-containing protein [Actinomadura fibrosa]
MTALLVGSAVGLIGNLATSTVQIDAAWWAPATWSATAALVVAAVALGWYDGRRTLKVAAQAERSAEVEAGEAFAAVRREYAERLRDRYRRVDLEVLLPSDQSEHPAMLLGEVFVPQLVRTDPPPRELLELPREVLQRLVGAGELTELPGGVDRIRLQRVQRTYQNRPARPVLAAVAAAAGGVVVLGDPGAGKSTFARYLMLALAAGELHTDDATAAGLPADLAERLPVMVELRQFADPRWRDAKFLDFLDDRYQREGLGLPRPMLERFLSSGGRALVVFDGLDEIFEPRQRNAIARQIDWFARSHPQLRVVVTSRVIGYNRAVFDRAGFTTLMLQDLTRQQVRQFTTAWFDRSCAGRPADAVRLRNRILTAVADSPAVAELAGNPMLLTILAIIARRRELPRDRRTVYQHAVMLLIDQWDVNKELADQHTGLPRLEPRDKLRMLHTVARRMQDGPAGLAGNHLPGDELTALFRNYFTGQLALPTDRAVQAARTMLQQLRDRNFILASYGADLYGFVHRAFLEYLAADEINQRFTNRALNEQELLEIYGTRWSDSSWTEVLLLLAGMVPEQFAVAAIIHLLNADPAWRARSGPPHHLLLALRAAAEIDHSPQLTSHARTITIAVIELINTVRKRGLFGVDWMNDLSRALPPIALASSAGRRWLQHERYQRWYLSSPGPSPASRRLAARCYLLTRPQSLPQLQHTALHEMHADVRRAAVEAVGAGWAGDPEVLPWLRDRATNDHDTNVRWTAVQAMGAGWADDPENLMWLSDRAINDRNANVRRAAVEAMGVGWAGDPEILLRLGDRATNDQDASVRLTAVQAMGSGWAGNDEALTLLRTRAAKDQDNDVRWGAVKAVGVGWAGDAKVLAWLRDRAINDHDDDVRRIAVEAIGTGWDGDDSVLTWLGCRATDDRHGSVRQAAVLAVGTGWAGDAKVLARLRDRATNDQDTNVRQAAVLAVGAGWSGDPEILVWLRDCATHHQDASVRRTAVEAAGSNWSSNDEALALLRDRAGNDLNASVRRAAVQAMGTGWPGDAKVLVWLRDRATNDRDASVRQSAMQAVEAAAVSWMGDPAILAWLGDRATNDQDASVRLTAVQAMGLGWPGDAEVLARLRDRAINDQNTDVRQVAVETMGSGWPDDEETLILLRDRATNDEHANVRHAAAALLAFLT